MIIDIFVIMFTVFIVFKLEARNFPYASVVFIFLYIVYIYSGTIMMYYDENILYSTNFETLQLVVRGGFLSIVLAYVSSYILVRRTSLLSKECLKLSISKDYAFYFVSILVIFISSLYLILIPSNPFIAMIKDPTSLNLIRQQATTTFSSFGFFNNFISFFLPLVWLTFLFMKKRIYIPLFLLNLLLLMSTGQKSPIVYLIFLLVISISLKNKKFNYKRNVSIFIIIMISLLLIVILQNWHGLAGFSFNNIELAWQGLQRRIFYGGVLPLSQYLEFFPSNMQHYYFDTPDIPPDKLVYAYSYPNTGIIGTVNTISLGNIYAAFGNFYIVFIMFFILSFFIFVIDKILFNYMSNPFEFAMYAMYSLLTIKLVITDWYSVVPQFFILSLSFLGAIYFIEAFLFYFASNKKRFIVYSNNKYMVFLAIAIFCYFLQGQIKGLLNG